MSSVWVRRAMAGALPLLAVLGGTVYALSQTTVESIRLGGVPFISTTVPTWTNTGVGAAALAQVSTGMNNTCVGDTACVGVTVESGNTVMGAQAYQQGAGYHNVLIGDLAAHGARDTGSFNVLIGSGVDKSATAGVINGAIVLGFGGIATRSGQFVVGSPRSNVNDLYLGGNGAGDPARGVAARSIRLRVPEFVTPATPRKVPVCVDTAVGRLYPANAEGDC